MSAGRGYVHGEGGTFDRGGGDQRPVPSTAAAYRTTIYAAAALHRIITNA